MNHLTAAWDLQRTANQIRSYLRQRASMYERQPGWKFSGRDDLIADLGQPFRWAPSEGLEMGEMGLCFQNALMTALDNGWDYCEGYAVVHGVPLHHAWATEDGRTAIDSTWPEGTDYFGVRLDAQMVSRRVQKRGYYGFFADVPDDEEMRWYKDGLPSGVLA